jgi:hypothetical protein
MRQHISAISLGPSSGTGGTSTLAWFRCQPWGSPTSGWLTLSCPPTAACSPQVGHTGGCAAAWGARRRALAASGNPSAGAPEEVGARTSPVARTEACGCGRDSSSPRRRSLSSSARTASSWRGLWRICGGVCGNDGCARQLKKAWAATARAGPRAFAINADVET